MAWMFGGLSTWAINETITAEDFNRNNAEYANSLRLSRHEVHTGGEVEIEVTTYEDEYKKFIKATPYYAIDLNSRVHCSWCGQWADPFTTCKHCGAPV
jgi:hypothetical protein